jgi:hypothetical protein
LCCWLQLDFEDEDPPDDEEEPAGQEEEEEEDESGSEGDRFEDAMERLSISEVHPAANVVAVGA